MAPHQTLPTSDSAEFQPQSPLLLTGSPMPIIVPRHVQFRRGSITPWHVHVLVPCAEKDVGWTVAADEYAADMEIPDLHQALRNLHCIPTFHTTTMSNYNTVLDKILAHANEKTIIFNLCDGTETDHRPGSSVIKELEKRKVAFTGAGSAFNDTSVGKTVMKEELRKGNVCVAQGFVFHGRESEEEINKTIAAGEIKYPAIVKPDVAYGAIGVSIARNAEDARAIIGDVMTRFGGVVVEEYIPGREFTALVVDDDAGHGGRSIVYPVLERVFDASLSGEERFLSQDVYWNQRFQCALAPEKDMRDLQKAARDAYVACGGTGYARVDMRMRENGEVVVLEVNALCGLSGGDDSSVGRILKGVGEGYDSLIERLLRYAVERREGRAGTSFDFARSSRETGW
ncbi:hypothetical protein HK104_001248 [Borealophlyctis nickersoniae]|nr:hypothetical protein HK104_001248 [Borealophlyctis nickersoniae]